MRVRGLKHDYKNRLHNKQMSHPMRVRGLKRLQAVQGGAP